MSCWITAGGAPVRSWRAGSRSASSTLAALLVAAAMLPAQEPGAAPEPAAAPQYGRVLVDSAQLRCWPSAVAAPPVFEDALTKGQVVAVGRSDSGFRLIALPFGPSGYVSKKFAVLADDGKVRTKGTKVAFRYKPRTNEAPLQQLADGQELTVIGEQDDWWRVRLAGVEAWLPEAEVQIGDQADATLATGFAESKAKYEAEIQARLDQIEQARKRAEQDQADEAGVLLVADAFAGELKKSTGEQQFAPLEAALDKLEASLAKESKALGSIATLRQRIQTQKWIVEATVVRDSKPVPGPESSIVPQPKDELEKFQSIGWLRYESRLGGVGQYYIEKGGQRQHLVSCLTGRYDLALFIGREVGVLGPRRRPATESLSVLDVERLEVLGGRPN